MSIIITDLCKTYDDNEVLKNVNITLEDSSIYCLMGASVLSYPCSKGDYDK